MMMHRVALTPLRHALWSSLASKHGSSLAFRYQPIAIRSRLSPRLSYTTLSTAPPEKESFRTLTRKYGAVAVGVYLSISFTVFSAILGSITLFDVTPHDIHTFLTRVKSHIPFMKQPTVQELDEEEEQARLEADKTQHEGVIGWMNSKLESSNPKMVQLLTNALLSIAVAKLFSPIKLAITVLITPSVARRLKSMGFKLGRK